MAITGKNQLASGAPPLRAVELIGDRYPITRELALALNLCTLEKLVISSTSSSLLTKANDAFWPALMMRGLKSFKLKELQCPRLTPKLVDFLCSFDGLERLSFHFHFYPVVPSDKGDDSEGVQGDRGVELKLLDAFFDKVLQAHGASLRSLALCDDAILEEPWDVTPAYLKRIRSCKFLKELCLPIRYPFDDLVCVPTH